jgi:outer membrane protein assembly factor BamB
LFGDAEDARFIYQLGGRNLSRIDAATWQTRWTTAIPVPHSFGASGQHALTPRFFRGYTEIVAGGPVYSVDGPPPAVLPDQVVTAVDARGTLLVSCAIHPAARDPVLLPRAAIVLVPGVPSELGAGVAAYSTKTGARLWHVPGEMFVTSGDTVYVTAGTPKPGVAAYDAATGRRLWSHPPRGRALRVIAVLNGIVYAERSPATEKDLGAVLALRARDGRRLWHLGLTPDDGPDGPEFVSVGLSSVLVLPRPADSELAARNVRLVSVTTGRVLASASIYNSDDFIQPWQTWPALLGDHDASVVAGGCGGASTVTAAHGYPSSIGPGFGECLAAVARNVAYFISGWSAPPDSTFVTAIDLRTGQPLWDVKLPPTDLSEETSLVPYDHGFALRLSDGRLLRYQ